MSALSSEPVAKRKRKENLEHARAVRSVRSFTGAPIKKRAAKAFPLPKTLFVNSYRYDVLERIAKLATELCVSVDRASEDVGGSRPALTILQEIGPLTDQLERLK